MKGWRPAAGRRHALIAAFFLLFAAATSYPLALNPGALIGQHGDAMFSVWRLAWIAHQLRADPLHPFDANIFYPERLTLAYSDAILLPAAIAAPLHWAGLPPVVVYNAVLLGAFVLNALTAYLLVRHLTGSMAAGVLGGLIFAFAPFRFDHFDHLEMQLSFWMPLCLLAWHRAIESGHARRLLLAGTLAACQVLSCIYYGVFLLTWLAVMTLGWFLRRPRAAAAALAWTVLLPSLVLAIYSVPYLQNRAQLGDRSVSDVIGWSARPIDFLSAPASNVLYGWTASWAAAERHLLPGATALILAGVGLWPLADRVRRLYALGALLAVLLALGFNAFLYPVLYEFVLPYRGLRVPARAMILLLLSVAVLSGFGLATLLARVRSRARAAIAACVVCAACAEYFATPELQAVAEPASGWYRTLGDMPDAIVFEWPVSHPQRVTEMVDVRYMYRSTLHWRPLLNGYSGNYPESYLHLLVAMRSFPDTGSIRYLQRVGATVLVVHDVAGSRPSYDAAVARLARDPSIRVLAQDRDGGRRVAFFQLAPEPRPPGQ